VVGFAKAPERVLSQPPNPPTPLGDWIGRLTPPPNPPLIPIPFNGRWEAIGRLGGLRIFTPRQPGCRGLTFDLVGGPQGTLPPANQPLHFAGAVALPVGLVAWD